jgi:hypothetical protein
LNIGIPIYRYNVSDVYFSVIRRLSFRFPLLISITSSLLILAIGSANDIFSLANEEERQKQQLPLISSFLDDGSGYLYYRAAAFIKELESLIKNFEYTFDLEGSQIFPNNNIKQNIVSEYESSEYNIDDLNYELLGFKITASDVKIHVDPKKIDDSKTRVDIPLMLAKDVKVSNSPINLSYNEVDLGSVYGIYDKTIDKMTVHVPVSVAIKYIQQ